MSKRKRYTHLLAAAISAASILNPAVVTAHAAGNPYGGGWANCTWGAWQLTYEKLGIELPGFGNAYEWYGRAQKAGYNVGATPAANSIVVWSRGRTGLGHVAYVDYVNADGTIFIEEGGNRGHYAARTVNPYMPDSSLQLTGYIYLGDATQTITYDVAESNDYSLSGAQIIAVNDVLAEAMKNSAPKIQLGKTDKENAEPAILLGVNAGKDADTSHYVVYGDLSVDYTEDSQKATIDVRADDEITAKIAKTVKVESSKEPSVKLSDNN